MRRFFRWLIVNIPKIVICKGDYVILAGTKDDFQRTHPVVDIDQDFIKGYTPAFYKLYRLKEDVSEKII